MTVKITRQSYPGLSQLVIDLGLGRPPLNTSYGDIARALQSIDGVEVENVGGLRAEEGVWGINRTTSRTAGKFTEAEMALVRAVAERIAAKG
jgi:hypothetical protein